LLLFDVILVGFAGNMAQAVLLDDRSLQFISEAIPRKPGVLRCRVVLDSRVV
jgi:hypothetical protein